MSEQKWQSHGVSFPWWCCGVQEETAGYRACKEWLGRQRDDVTIRLAANDRDLIAFNWDTHTLLAKAPSWSLLASELGLVSP